MRVSRLRRGPDGLRPHVIIVDGQGRAGSLSRFSLKFKAIALALPAFALAVPVIGVGNGSNGSIGYSMVMAARATITRAADLIRSRSPGTRTSAHLIKTKKAAPPHRVARALPRVRGPAPVPALLTPPPPALPLQFSEFPVPDLPIVPFDTPILTAEASPCPCDFAFIPPMLGGGGVVFGPGPGGTIPIPPINPPVTPPVGVPEPSSWVYLIMGFVVIGNAVRRRKQLISLIKNIPLLVYAPSARI